MHHKFAGRFGGMAASSLQVESRPGMRPHFAQLYREYLADFCSSEDESLLPKVRNLVQELVNDAVSSDAVATLHAVAVEELATSANASRKLVASQRFLLNVMVTFGTAYGALAERLLAEAVHSAEEERAHADDVEQAEKRRLELLAGVSHELGTPLTVVKGNVAAIRRFLEQNGHWPDALTPRATDVAFAVERMLLLRDDLLAASRNEQRKLESVPLHLVRSVQRVVRWAQTDAAEKGIQLTEEDSAAVPYIMGDEGAVQSIFSNLASNATRYTRQGGQIQVKTSNEGGAVVVRVTDTGIGMSEAEQQRIFERFYRAPAAQETAVFGLGLGLAITRDLVSAQGGTISVQSEPGTGSTFTVAFPVADLADDTD
jgi:signal transduction histidine kinase